MGWHSLGEIMVEEHVVMLRLVKKTRCAIEHRWAKSSGERFTRWLRKKGCKVGEGVQWHGLRDISIDTTRPSLIEIGDNVCFTRGCTILTHGYDWFVLRNLYHEILCSSGKVRIGSNVFLGTWVVIVKGVTIGDNCIIGACSLVNKDVPSNSVAAGNPVKIVCSIEEYYQKRKKAYVEEAKAYARSIRENLGRDPVPADFWEEFPLFVKAGEMLEGVPVRRQLGPSYESYRRSHQPVYESLKAFLRDAGLEG